jgi:3-polyprenyl-4-hydroxybenzoate decarboxylase
VKAIAAPIPPRVVERAPCHDIVTLGDDLDKDGAALEKAARFRSRRPASKMRLICREGAAPARHESPLSELRAGIYAHWLKYKKRGEPLPCAVVVGAPPVVSYASVQKMPENLDELAVAGALAGSAIDVLRCKTVDLFVPAESEIVIEGQRAGAEAPFGESHGYVNLHEYNAFMRVTAITRRRNPILTSFISQVAPSESSVIRRVTMEALFLNYLRNGLSIKASSASRYTSPSPIYIAIQFERGTREPEVWRALNGVSTLHRFASKWVIAIDDDIDPDNADALFWAMSYRCQPQHDIQVVPLKDPGHGPRGPRDNGEGASVLINALLESRTARSRCRGANTWRTRRRYGSVSDCRR